MFFISDMIPKKAIKTVTTRRRENNSPIDNTIPQIIGIVKVLWSRLFSLNKNNLEELT